MENKKILVGVTGGIAIYKICDLVRMLVKKENLVKVVMTENAAKLVSPVIFRTLSRSAVCVDVFGAVDESGAGHINLAQWADTAIIAPATANTIGKIANGIADNLLTATIMALPESVPLFVAPAMNVNMWNNVFVQENMKKIIARKNCFIAGPVLGPLADGTVGAGRMAEPVEILDFVEQKMA